MGADIHLYIEYKDDKGNWVIDENQKCESCNGTGEHPNEIDDDHKDCGFCYGDGYKKCDINRSYLLFSILADVRNGYGLNPISDPRGIPQDASEEYKKIANNDDDAHSHSYHTVKQIKKYKKQYTGTDDEGYVSIKIDWEYLKGYFPIDLEELAKKHGGDNNVRIVFFFDN